MACHGIPETRNGDLPGATVVRWFGIACEWCESSTNRTGTELATISGMVENTWPFIILYWAFIVRGCLFPISRVLTPYSSYVYAVQGRYGEATSCCSSIDQVSVFPNHSRRLMKISIAPRSVLCFFFFFFVGLYPFEVMQELCIFNSRVSAIFWVRKDAHNQPVQESSLCVVGVDHVRFQYSWLDAEGYIEFVNSSNRSFAAPSDCTPS